MIALITKYYDDKKTYKVIEGEEAKQYKEEGLISSTDECDVYVDLFKTKEELLDKWDAYVDEEAIEEA